MFARLKANGMGEYEPIFRNEAIDGVALAALTEEDMKELGIKLGHR